MKINFNKQKANGVFKILTATNGGPWCKRHATDQFRSNFDDYKAAKFPYSRNHDSNAIHTYGGPYAHDISSVFPNFDADVNDPNSYDFACTDESILTTIDAGTKIYYRLGETIENQIKKHHTLPPKDFNKWAEICEHIILHYNYGWADGFKLGIEYWEIWNEPDLDINNDDKRTWGGTTEQFYDLYEVTAKRLKTRFPELKIGGPAIAFDLDWSKEFLLEMKRREVPIDFFSWHIYASEPQLIIERGEKVHKILMETGYSNAESILNEWNYVKGWVEEFKYSIMMIHGIKGATFTMASISAAASSPIDMMMYYDTRPGAFCGAFDIYSYDKLPGYYPFYWYGKFYEEGMREVKADNQYDQIYTLCGVGKDGKAQAIITHYSDEDNVEDKNVEISFGESGKYEVYYLDEIHDPDKPEVTDKLTFKMKLNTCIFIKEL